MFILFDPFRTQKLHQQTPALLIVEGFDGDPLPHGIVQEIVIITRGDSVIMLVLACFHVQVQRTESSLWLQ